MLPFKTFTVKDLDFCHINLANFASRPTSIFPLALSSAHIHNMSNLHMTSSPPLLLSPLASRARSRGRI